MNHSLQAVAWTLIHFCWQAAVIAALYAVAARVTMRRSSHVRYAVALSAMAALVAAAALTFAWEMLPAAQPHAAGIAGASVSGPLPHAVQARVIQARVIQALGADAPAIANRLPSLTFWVDVLWLLGVCALSVRNLGGWWVIRRLRLHAAACAPPAELQSRFVRIAAALGLRKDVLLRISDAIAGPITVGAFRTVVLLPLSALSGLGTDELEMVLAHELAHVRRADFLCNLLQTLVETLFFFHPAVWWISNGVRHERELCCDDLALEVCPNPVVYASALYRLEEQRSRQLHLAMALDGHQSRQTLRMRIARILGEPAASSGRAARPFSLAAVLAGVAVLLLSAPQVIASFRPAHLAPQVAAVIHNVASTPQISAFAAVAPVRVAAAIHAAQTAPPASAPQASTSDAPQAPGAADSGPHTTYIDRMKAAGYDVDLDKMIAMKIQDVTPEYARAMAQVGLGKPSADDLIACKIQGVSPEVIAQLKQQGLEVSSFQDAISYRIFNITPEFVKGMKDAGFGNLKSKQLLALRVQDVTPEYARSIVQQFPGATVDDIISTRIFKIDADFIASAKQHGFKDLTLKKLIQLRISGILDDESK
ncbi:MAG TPA: M56 family metallopeptidase [Terracidiphilus sp.]|jgi:beta-lactamase regulating signal transducer with metallopeptidase domain|nr:M56 family metallopeptidase [Terracidiphilus sp.]